MFKLFSEMIDQKRKLNICGQRIITPFEYFSKIDIGEIHIGEDVLAIKESAFESCTSLASISLHSNIHLIEPKAFYNTKYYDTISNWQNGALYIDSALIKVDNEYKGVFIVKPGTTIIASEAFGGEFAPCKNITEIILPDTLKYICPAAFEGCDALKTMTIPESVRVIGSNAFRNCTNLESITINAPLQTISESCFACCNKLKTINLPTTLKKIEKLAFAQCYQLETINFPNQLEIIGSYAFQHCSELKSIYIPESIKVIDNAAFSICWNLSTIHLPNKVFKLQEGVFNSTEYMRNKDNWKQGVLYIGNHLIKVKDESLYFTILPGTITIAAEAFFEGFRRSSFTKIYIPDSVQYIGNSAFENCVKLCEINIPDSVINMGKNVFKQCCELETIVFPGSLSVIPIGVCNSCSKLKQVYFAKGTKYIDSDAFKGCKELLEIDIPFNVQFSPNAFEDYTKITRH